MRAAAFIMHRLAWAIIVMLVIPAGTSAQDLWEPEQADIFKKEELVQMLAPIALYPDSLLTQILMASTYPLEVVEAERWLRGNKSLKGEKLDAELQDKAWDPSVKSLCHFPDVLIALSDKLDQTRKLGDAYLSQPDDVMNTVQELRREAKQHGNLNTTKEQKVVVEREIIRIEPSDPQVVYVPVYNPLYVYGSWWYPAYPPYYWYYPPGYVFSTGFIGFSRPYYYGFGFSWSWFDWRVRHIYVDRHKTKRFHRYRDKHPSERHVWRHEPFHRKGVAYRDKRTSANFGSRPTRVSPASPQVRGFPPGSAKRSAERPRVPIQRRESIAPAPVRPDRDRIQRAPRRDTPFRGIGDGRFERRAGQRGGESRRSIEMRRSDGDTRRPSGDAGRPGGVDRGRGGTPGSGGGFRR
jgi:hypothetical protein